MRSAKKRRKASHSGQGAGAEASLLRCRLYQPSLSASIESCSRRRRIDAHQAAFSVGCLLASSGPLRSLFAAADFCRRRVFWQSQQIGGSVLVTEKHACWDICHTRVCKRFERRSFSCWRAHVCKEADTRRRICVRAIPVTSCPVLRRSGSACVQGGGK